MFKYAKAVVRQTKLAEFALKMSKQVEGKPFPQYKVRSEQLTHSGVPHIFTQKSAVYWRLLANQHYWPKREGRNVRDSDVSGLTVLCRGNTAVDPK